MAGETKVPIRNLGQHGLITDKPPHELPANVWTKARNARFRNNFVERVGGHINIMPDYPQEPFGLTYFQNTWIYGTVDKLYQYEVGDATPHQERYTVPAGQNVTDAFKWTFSEFSNVLVASHPDGDPVFWNGVTQSPTAFQVLPDWGNSGSGIVTWRARRIRAFKNTLIALHTTEDGTEFGQRLRWSDIAPPNSPPLQWEVLPTNSANVFDLSNATSDIIDGFILGDSFVVYTKNEVYLMDFVGGNQVFSIRQIFNDVGILHEGCVAAFDNSHLVVGIDDVYIHNGSSRTSIITNKIKDDFFTNVQDFEYDASVQYTPRMEAITYTALNEIWIFYSTELQEGDTRTYFRQAAIWNYVDNTWTYTDIPILTDIANGGIPIASVLRWDNADDWDPDRPDMTWDQTDPLTWDGFGKDIEERILIGCGKNGFIALDQALNTSDIIIPFQLERQKIDLDEEVPAFDISLHKTVLSIYPQFNGTGEVTIRLGYSYKPNDNPVWTQPVFFNMDNDYKADFRVTGRYFSIRIEALDDKDWKLEGWQWHVGGIQQER